MSSVRHLAVGLLAASSLMAPRCARAHEGHEPLPTKGVLVDAERGTAPRPIAP
jgi:hypothetical protein